MAKVMKSEMKISEPYNGCEAPDLLGFLLSADVADCERHGETDHPY